MLLDLKNFEVDQINVHLFYGQKLVTTCINIEVIEYNNLDLILYYQILILDPGFARGGP